ncbi:MAG: metal-sulfur cluster assembly factor [Chloroflexota bacterium]
MSDAPNNNRPPWQADESHPELIAPFTSALHEVLDPEIGLSVIQLGLIRDLAIEDGSATVNMIMTTPFCPYAPALLEMTRQKAEAALGMPTKVAMGMEMWDFSYMEEGLGGDWGLY